MTDETPDLERWALLARYAAGECSPAERARVERWLAADPSRRLVLEEMRIAANDAAALAEPVDGTVAHTAKAQAWRRLRARMGAERRAAGSPWSRRLTTAGIGIAAALLMSIGIWRVLSRAPRLYATAPGQRESVTLADGTEFTLGPASQLRLAADYGTRRRDVSLVGEAFFAVVHDPAHPFVVHAGYARAEDVGTRFVVRAYPGDRMAQVAVADGAVALSDNAAQVASTRVLRRGALGGVDARGALSVTTTADVDRFTAWTRGELVFTEMPVRDVVVELSRWYGVDVTADSSLAAIPLLASFHDEPVTDVVRSVAAAIGATVEQNGRRIVLRRRPGSQH